MKLVKTPGLVRRLFPRQTTGPVPPGKPTLYLTFDDGPVPGITRDVIHVLKEKNVKATFFCVGQNMEKYPEIFQQIISNNHSVGNHTYSHLNGWKTPARKYFRDAQKFRELHHTRLFRPPYGRISVKQWLALRKEFHIVFWSILSRDFDPRVTPQKCFENVASHLHNGAIIVFHDNQKATKQVQYALPRIIDNAREKGYQFMAL